MRQMNSPIVFVLGTGGSAPICLEGIIRQEAGVRKSGGQRARGEGFLICFSFLEHSVTFFAWCVGGYEDKTRTSVKGLSTPLDTQMLHKFPFIHACFRKGNNLATHPKCDLRVFSSPSCLLPSLKK